ncbi:hypothetical protein Tco_0520092, partial [Tanacetum coccineum]
NVTDDVVYKELDDSLVRAVTTASSLEAEHDSGDGPRRQDTMRDIIAQTRFENVSKTSNDSLLTGVNTPRTQEITSLKLRVKKLEKKGGSRTHKLKRLYKVGRSIRVISSNEASLGDQEDASKQGRKIIDIDTDAEITLDMAEKEINVAEKEVSTADPVTTTGEVVTTASFEISIASPTETIIVDDLTLAQTLIEIRSAKPKVKGVVIGEQSESTTRTRPQQLPSKDKGKEGFNGLEEKTWKMKKKDQISFNEQEAIRLQAEFDEEVRLVREKDEANVALIEEWNDIQAKIDADYQLAQRLQAQEQEELTTKGRAKLFQQLLEKRRKHCAAKRNRAAMDIEMVEGSEVKAEAEIAQESSSKRAGEDLQQESTKKQKIDDVKETTEVDEDKETYELQSLMKVIPDEEEVAVDAIPLATMTSKFCCIQNSEDLETLWKLIKAKHGYTRLEEDYKRVLWDDLKIMFEPHVEDLLRGRFVGIKRLLADLRVMMAKDLMISEHIHVVPYRECSKFLRAIQLLLQVPNHESYSSSLEFFNWHVLKNNHHFSLCINTSAPNTFLKQSPVCDEIFAYTQVMRGIGALAQLLLQLVVKAASCLSPTTNLTFFEL